MSEETTIVSESEPPLSARSRDVAALKRNITSRLEYLRLYEAVTRGLVERDMLPLIAGFVREENDALERLAGLLRQMGEPVPAAEAGDRLVWQLRARRDTPQRMRFIRQGLVQAAEWYETRAGDETFGPEVRALFGELGALQRARLERLDALFERVTRRRL
jgi:hypothetical protein